MLRISPCNLSNKYPWNHPTLESRTWFILLEILQGYFLWLICLDSHLSHVLIYHIFKITSLFFHHHEMRRKSPDTRECKHHCLCRIASRYFLQLWMNYRVQDTGMHIDKPAANSPWGKVFLHMPTCQLCKYPRENLRSHNLRLSVTFKFAINRSLDLEPLRGHFG